MAKNTSVIYWSPTDFAPCPHPTYVCDEHLRESQRDGPNGFPEALKSDDPHRREQCRTCWMRGQG